MKVEVNLSKIKDIVVAELSGKLDSGNYEQIESRISEVISSGEKKILIDFSGLDYISSAGLRVFLSAAKKLKAENGRIVFTKMQEQVKEVFDVTGLLHVFKLVDNFEDAVKEFEG